MSEIKTVETQSPTQVKAKKGKQAGGSKKVRTKPSHPPTSDMVNAAIKNLKERGGSSLAAIKKYIAGTYKVDTEKLSPFIRKYLKSAVSNGKLIQTKGKGASGSFKLPVTAKPSAGGSSTTKASSPKKSVKPKAKTAKKVSKPKVATAAAKTAKKTGKAKSAAAPKQKPTKASTSKPKAAKKPKTPKPKKLKKSPKKAAKA